MLHMDYSQGNMEANSNASSGAANHTAKVDCQPGLNILIAGAGIGGLTAAIGLRRQGHKIRIFEKASEVRAPGYGIHLAPNGVGLLRALGVRIEDGGAVQMDAIRFFKHTGEVFSKEDRKASAHKWQNQWFLTSRIELHSELLRLATSPDGEGEPAKIQTSCGVMSVDVDGSVVLSDGSSVAADVVIGADGVASKARDAILKTEPYPSKYNCFRMMLDKEEVWSDPSSYHPAENTMDMIYSPKTKTVIYPVLGNTKFNCVVTHLTELTTGHIEDPKAKMMELVQDHDSTFRQFLAKADPERFRIWPLFDMETLPTYTKGRLAILGDAAHPFTPHLAQGGMMAVEDAVSLSIMLASGISREEVPKRLQLYDGARRGRGTFMQKLSLAVGGDRVDFINGDDSGQPLNVQKYLDQALSHDENHASAQLLREWEWSRRPQIWIQPIKFGPVSPAHAQYLDSAESSGQCPFTTIIRFTTSATMLRELLPDNYSFVEVDSVAVASISIQGKRSVGDNLEYSMALYVHGVQYMQPDGAREISTSGTHCLVLFESSPDTATINRERFGLPARCSDFHINIESDSFEAQLSWRGTKWARLRLSNLQVTPDSELTNGFSSEIGKGLLVHKFISASVVREKILINGNNGIQQQQNWDVNHSILYPAARSSPGKTAERPAEVYKSYSTVDADLQFDALSPQQAPTLWHLLSRLAEIPIKSLVEARVGIGCQQEFWDWDDGKAL